MSTAVKNLIGGEWVEAQPGDTLETISPATEEVLGTVAKSADADIDAAVAAACNAPRSTRTRPWANPKPV